MPTRIRMTRVAHIIFRRSTTLYECPCQKAPLDKRMPCILLTQLHYVKPKHIIIIIIMSLRLAATRAGVYGKLKLSGSGPRRERSFEELMRRRSRSRAVVQELPEKMRFFRSSAMRFLGVGSARSSKCRCCKLGWFLPGRVSTTSIELNRCRCRSFHV